jgi:alpha-1,2-mannosyltransferase
LATVGLVNTISTAPAATTTRRLTARLYVAAPVLLILSVAARLAWTYLAPNGANFVDLHV